MYKLLVIGIVFLLGLYFISQSNKIETFTTGGLDDYKIAGKCPDVLIQKGAAFFLYNSKRANVPGVNPIRFESLEEYTEFVEWQRSQGILCPVLYLQHAYNAQGDAVYKARPSPTNMQGGAPDYIVTPASLPGMQEIKSQDIPINVASMEANMIPPPANVPVQGLYGREFTAPGKLKGGIPMMQLPPQGMQPPQQSGYNNNTYSGFDPHNQGVGLNTPLDKMFTQTNGASPNPMDDSWGGIEFTEAVVKSGYYKGDEVGKVTF
jgi:hypothetical protein